jgi:hypothetical protein
VRVRSTDLAMELSSIEVVSHLIQFPPPQYRGPEFDPQIALSHEGYPAKRVAELSTSPGINAAEHSNEL